MRWQVFDAEPVVVFDVMVAERQALVECLSGLADEAWASSTDCPGWQVREVVAHVLHDDLRLLAHLRDGYRGVWFDGALSELGPWLHERNQRFVDGTADLSPGLLVDLLAWSGERLGSVYRSRDPRACEDAVAWGVPDGPCPNWLGTGREYTERLAHQNQIRRAVGVPVLGGAKWLGPALDIWRWCLPVAFADTLGSLALTTRDPDRRWLISDGRFVDNPNNPDFDLADARVVLDAARLAAVWTAAPSATLGDDAIGDASLLDALRSARSIIV